ncbi:hypothetical protein VNI00_017730 [Paramarasmius palmivorus]|uniref:Uncharacterized protein n=1 Tax=Paramarasmius palmivorus TaxID=297713 RepID=A0AAW0B5V5_9AGAR
MFLTPKRVHFTKGVKPKPVSLQDIVPSETLLSSETKAARQGIKDQDIEDENEVFRLLVPRNVPYKYQEATDSESHASDSEEDSSSQSDDEMDSVFEQSSCQDGNDQRWAEEASSDEASECESFASDDGETDFQEALLKWVNRDVSIFPPKSPPTYHELRPFGPTKFDKRPEGMSDKEWKSVLTGTFDRWWNDLYEKHKVHTEYMMRGQSPIGDRECSSRRSNTFWNDLDPQF